MKLLQRYTTCFLQLKLFNLFYVYNNFNLVSTLCYNSKFDLINWTNTFREVFTHYLNLMLYKRSKKIIESKLPIPADMIQCFNTNSYTKQTTPKKLKNLTKHQKGPKSHSKRVLIAICSPLHPPKQKHLLYRPKRTQYELLSNPKRDE